MSNNARFTWTAEVKENPHPYICANGCPPGYLWRKEARMCVQVQTNPATFTQAEAICAQDNARLASFKSCSKFVGLSDHLMSRDPDPTNKYWIGAYVLGMERIGSTGLMSVQEGVNNDCNEDSEAMYTVDGSSNVNLVPISFNGYHSELVFKADGTPLIMVHEFEKQDSTTAGSFLCEKDESWTCPEGSIFFQKICYQLNILGVSQPEAEYMCSSNGGKLLNIQDRMQHTFITAAFPPSVHNYSTIWLSLQTYTNNPLDNLYYEPESILTDFKFDSSSATDYTSVDQPYVENENCVVLDGTDTTIINSFKKVSCHQNSSFVCEYPLQLTPYLVKIMPEIQLLMPLDSYSGIQDLAYPTRQNSESLLAMTEEVILESGLIGSSNFMGSALSYVDIENTGTNKEMKSSFGISISMWVYIDLAVMFDNEIQMLIDARGDCNDGLEVSQGFTMFLTKTPATHTVAEFMHDQCGLIYNNSIADLLPSPSMNPSFQIRANVELCSKQADDTILCTQIASSDTINQLQWVQIGFTFNDVSKRGTFFVDETYGYTNLTDAKKHNVKYFDFDTNGWFSESAVNTIIRVGSAKFQAPEGQKNFAGKISCLQMYEGPLTLAQFITLSKCPVSESYLRKASLCPPEYDYYKGSCYKLSEKEEEFSTAEALCVPPSGKLNIINIIYYEKLLIIIYC